MTISLYEASIPGYLQVLDALGVVMAKGAEHYRARDEDVDTVDGSLPRSLRLNGVEETNAQYAS